MFTTIQKWGNSQAVRIPKGILEVVDFHENDRVEINTDADCIIIKRANKMHTPLQDRIAEYTEEYTCVEWDVGPLHGNEV